MALKLHLTRIVIRLLGDDNRVTGSDSVHVARYLFNGNIHFLMPSAWPSVMFVNDSIHFALTSHEARLLHT